jgi:hypothetical protein
MSQLLRKADSAFIFAHRAFVVRLLGRCQAVSQDLVKSVIGDFYGSISGVRSSIFGEPSPQDIDQRAKAADALAQISRLSPAYELYDYVRRSAEESIALSRRQGEALDDE